LPNGRHLRGKGLNSSWINIQKKSGDSAQLEGMPLRKKVFTGNPSSVKARGFLAAIRIESKECGWRAVGAGRDLHHPACSYKGRIDLNGTDIGGGVGKWRS